MLRLTPGPITEIKHNSYMHLRVVEGAGTPVPPLDMHPPRARGMALIYLTINLHIYSDFLLFLSIDNVTLCPFYDYFSNSFVYLNLLYISFFAGFHLK